MQIIDWKRNLEENWSLLRFGDVKVETRDGQYIFEVLVRLNDLNPDGIRIELYADGAQGGAPERHKMKLVSRTAGSSGSWVYSAAVSAVRPSADYTARAIPCFDGVSVPLETHRILWQR